MAELLERLKTLENRIKVGVIGIGSMGKGLAYQATITPGIEAVAIADTSVERAIACAQWLGADYQVVDSPRAANDAVRAGKLAVAADGQLIAACEPMDVLIESSSAVGAGGTHALAALESGKHVVMMNAEADLVFGPYLLAVAKRNGVVYTGADGDQPAVLKRLIDEILLWGFELVIAGNIKGYLDRYANPTMIVPEADKRGLDYRMCTSYTDGTKLCVEMAVLANSLGLRTAVPGMYGPRAAHVMDVFTAYDLDALWASRLPVVDYILGAQPPGGVFAIGYTGNTYQQETLAWYPPKLGPGPFYVFYRPYHLGHFETMASVAEAALDKHAVFAPERGFQTNVYARAKRDLRRGEVLDGIGGYACYGQIENCSDNVERPGLPICLSDGLPLTRDVAKDERIALTDVVYEAGSGPFALYQKAIEHSRAANGWADA